jgi:uncharacterized repeat protein (TIGR03803 family)
VRRRMAAITVCPESLFALQAHGISLCRAMNSSFGRRDGNLYGTTVQGGANCPPYGCGTIFKITPSGTLTTLHSFDDTDGTEPHGLIQATNGNFYGTTAFGGANGEGTVFEITPSGTLTTLHSFDGADGEAPQAALIQATDGNFYGTTSRGGANKLCPPRRTVTCGTVFKITPTGTLTTLASFGEEGGSVPFSPLIQATDGILLRDNAQHGLQGHPKRHADHACQRLLLLRGAGPGHRWELLRDNGIRGQRCLRRWLWDGLQSDTKWHADHATQLHQQRQSNSSADPGHRRKPLRDNWRGRG